MKTFSQQFVILLLNLTTIACAQSQPVLQTSPTANDNKKQPSTFEIKIDNFSFTPATLTVPVGATVTWVNNDDIPHNIVSSDQKFPKSKPLDTGDKYSFTFTTVGTYQYFCGLHPKMVGKVLVEETKK